MNRARTQHLVAVSKKGFRESSCRSFRYRIRGELFQGVVVHYLGKFYAYENLCKHLPVSLDAGDGEFMSPDQTNLQCHMHGAIYEINTGLCTGGPCVGASLNRLEVTEDETQLIVKIPIKS